MDERRFVDVLTSRSRERDVSQETRRCEEDLAICYIVEIDQPIESAKGD